MFSAAARLEKHTYMYSITIYVYMYVYAHIYIYTRIYVHLFIYVHICKHIKCKYLFRHNVYVCVYIYIYMSVGMPRNALVPMPTLPQGALQSSGTYLGRGKKPKRGLALQETSGVLLDFKG